VNITLAAIDLELADAFQKRCGRLPNVAIHCGSILDLEVDAVVSPANSFGFMDGGIDFLYSEHFGWRLQAVLQQKIRSQHHGELLVGQAEFVWTENDRIPMLVAAPTMRVPMILPRDTINPYLATRAAMREAFRRGARSIAFPGMGTGVGRVPFDLCARQMAAAIRESQEIEETCERSFPENWFEASKAHQKLYTDDVRDLQSEPNR
jgi:O-acetyl-ADP-ribose deacetylase (regulator of RNase III)